jgi:hypothetical protein
MMFALLSVAGVFADGAATNKAKEWPYGPYDKLHRDPPLIQKNETSIIRSPVSARGQILIYRGTQPEVVVPPTTNTIIAPKLESPPTNAPRNK